MLSVAIVGVGYANVMLIVPDVMYKDMFLRTYKQARNGKTGL